MKLAMNIKPFLVLSRAFFFLGVSIGFALSAILIWNNLESSRYFFTSLTYAPFKGLRCPVMIAPTEKGSVAAAFNNPTNEDDNFFYRAEISGKAFSKRRVEGQTVVPPHQSKTIRFAVNANDVDLMFFILVKITIMPNSVHPSQQATCGIMVANLLELKGAQVSGMALFLSLSGIVIGLGSWQQTRIKADREMRRIALALGTVVLFTLLTAYMGWWGIAIALSVITVLLSIMFMRFALA
jgi:hypothetical protein